MSYWDEPENNENNPLHQSNELSPSEKALQIANNYYQGSPFDYDKPPHLTELRNAQKRALFCCNEVLNTIQGSSDNITWLYWLDVKTEIEKLITK